MKPNALKVLERAIEEGVVYGIRRHYKHRDDCPPESEIANMADHISEHVMGGIYEWFEFDDLLND